MIFIVTTTHENDRSKVMEIARERSIMYSHAFGAGDYCETEMQGTFEDYCVIEKAIKEGQINGEIEEAV